MHNGEVLKPPVIGFHELNVMIRLCPTLYVSSPYVLTNDGKSIPLKLRKKPLGEDHVLLFVQPLSILSGPNYSSLMFYPHQ